MSILRRTFQNRQVEDKLSWCSGTLWFNINNNLGICHSQETIWIRALGGSFGSNTSTRLSTNIALGETGQADLGVTVSPRCSLLRVRLSPSLLPLSGLSFSVSLFHSVGQVTLCTGRSHFVLSASKLFAQWLYGFQELEAHIVNQILRSIVKKKWVESDRLIIVTLQLDQSVGWLDLDLEGQDQTL